MDKELINKVAEIYRERSVHDLTKAIEIITLVTQENKAAVIEAVAELIELQFGLKPKLYRNSKHVDESIEDAFNTALDTEVK